MTVFMLAISNGATYTVTKKIVTVPFEKEKASLLQVAANLERQKGVQQECLEQRDILVQSRLEVIENHSMEEVCKSKLQGLEKCEEEKNKILKRIEIRIANVQYQLNRAPSSSSPQ